MQEIADWTILVYMRPTSEYSNMAFKNINDMLSSGINTTTKLFVQVHAYGDYALRYQVTPALLRQNNKILLTGDDKQDIPDAFAWAIKQAPARRYMLVLWGSGFGILDPRWNEANERWEPQVDDNEMPLSLCQLTVGTEKRYRSMKDHFKGILLSKDPQLYTSNNDFVASLAQINKMLGKPLDIIGLDMCLGGMVEIAYQCAPYAHYLIASQNCELKDGWDYGSLGDVMHGTTTEEVACGMAYAFEKYYLPRAPQGNYTQVVVELSHLKDIKESFDHVISLMGDCNRYYGKEFKDALIRARKKSNRFCFMPMYTDIVTLCDKMQEELRTLLVSPALLTVSDALEHLKISIKQAVKANVTGYQMRGVAHGLSIYFPFAHIDQSYVNSFTQDSYWLYFLEYIVQ